MVSVRDNCYLKNQHNQPEFSLYPHGSFGYWIGRPTLPFALLNMTLVWVWRLEFTPLEGTFYATFTAEFQYVHAQKESHCSAWPGPDAVALSSLAALASRRRPPAKGILLTRRD